MCILLILNGSKYIQQNKDGVYREIGVGILSSKRVGVGIYCKNSGNGILRGVFRGEGVQGIGVFRGEGVQGMRVFRG